MANHALRTIVAVTLETIHKDNGFVPQARSAATNTQTKVFNKLKQNPKPDLEPAFWQCADEVVDYFRILETLPEYKTISQRDDAAVFKTCIDVAKGGEIGPVEFPYAVMMPHLYGTLIPKEPKTLNVLTSEAKLIEPGNFMGKLNEPDRFFVKLVHIGKNDATKGGTLFELRDRSGNMGFFFDKPDKFAGTIRLGDCFAIHATPTRHTKAPTGEKHTIFRTVEIVMGTIVPGKGKIDPTQDETRGRFT